METIFVLLPLALLIAALAVGSFIWAARSGQFDDLETPPVRILFDDEEPRGTTGTRASLDPTGETARAGTPPKPSPTTTAESTRRAPE